MPGKGIYLAEVVSLPVEKSRSTFIKLRLMADGITLKCPPSKHYINAYFMEKKCHLWPRPGEVIIFNAELSSIRNPGNPNEFDYAEYLAKRKVYSSCFIKDTCWQILNIASGLNRFHIISMELKELLQQYIRETAKEKGGYGYEVMLAICTGDKSELDRDLKASYSSAGAIHVMAVSGMHVGMIWVFLSYLTFFLRKKLFGRILQFLFLLCILWFYALLTGLSPSVIRSCTMFTIASIANLINRNKGIFNSIFISAILQLAINPLMLFDAGFQFSYTAVLSILLFQPVLSSLVHSNHPILKKITDLISVSISAQILTFPLSAYYFHQFPVYFILTNVCVIPLVTLLMTGFILSILFIFIPIVSENLIYFSLILTDIMNGCVTLINRLPGSLIPNLNFTLLQVFILFFASLLMLRFYLVRKFSIFTLSICFLILFYSAGTNNYLKNHKDRLCVYNIKGYSAVEICDGNEHFLFYHDSIIPRKDLEYASSGFRIKNYYKDPREILLSDKNALSLFHQIVLLPGSGNLIYLTEKKIITFIMDHSIFKNNSSTCPVYTDILILGGRYLPEHLILKNFFQYQDLIITSSIPNYHKSLTEIGSLNYNYHQVSIVGAFVNGI